MPGLCSQMPCTAVVLSSGAKGCHANEKDLSSSREAIKQRPWVVVFIHCICFAGFVTRLMNTSERRKALQNSGLFSILTLKISRPNKSLFFFSLREIFCDCRKMASWEERQTRRDFR